MTESNDSAGHWTGGPVEKFTAKLDSDDSISNLHDCERNQHDGHQTGLRRLGENFVNQCAAVSALMGFLAFYIAADAGGRQQNSPAGVKSWKLLNNQQKRITFKDVAR